MDIVIPRQKFNIQVIALMLLIAIALPLLYASLSPGVDWTVFYKPAALAVLEGRSPYTVPGFYNPPWILLPLLPLALLPERISSLIIFLAIFFTYVYILVKIKAKPVPAILFLFSWPVIGCLYYGNMEGILLLGLFLPSPIGLAFTILKPQTGAGAAVYWLVEAWRAGGMRRAIAVFLPVGLLLAGSFLLYGIPPFSPAIGKSWNISIFPYTIPVGIFVLIDGIRRRKILSGAAASPFFSPYFTEYSLAGLLLYLIDRPRLFFVAWVLLWLPSAARLIGR